MLLYEFRIVLPLSVEEYQVGQLYAVAEASKGETGGGEGVEVLENREYEEDDEKGQFTDKIYYLKSKVPSFISSLAPKGALELNEKAWNAYPYCKTILTNGYMKDKMVIDIRTWHKPDMGDEENVHGLDNEEWETVKVVQINIAAPVSAKDYKAEEDPTKFKSKVTGRGELSEDWQEKLREKVKNDPNTPHMCCYKLVRVKFNWMGISKRVEDFIMKFEERLFTNFHRKLFCSLDDWHDLTMEDIRRIEAQTKAELDEMRNTGEVKGTK